MNDRVPMPEPSSLLQQLVDVGEAMQAALRSDNLERLSALLEERGALLEELRAFDHPAEVDGNWKRYRRALVRQNDVLQEALLGQEEHLTEALNQLEQYKDAQRRYDTGDQPPQVLNPELRG